MLARNNIICHFIRINRYGIDGDGYDDSNSDRGWSSNRPFFISHILEGRKRKKEKLSEHCGRLKDDVLFRVHTSNRLISHYNLVVRTYCPYSIL
jgi:hypothetical protein